MLFATARSVREERSKQRYALQDFSHIRVSLVKGKSGWRIGSAQALGNAFLQAESRKQRGLINFVFTQLRRYVHGEVSLPRVYDDAFEVIKNSHVFTTQQVQAQQIFLVRLLSELGYVAPEASWSAMVEAQSVQEALQQYDVQMHTAIASAVHEGTQASHL